MQVKSFEAHFFRKNSRKIYLHVDSKAQIYQIYCDEMEKQSSAPVSDWIFRRELNKNNIAVGEPPKDGCDTCDEVPKGEPNPHLEHAQFMIALKGEDAGVHKAGGNDIQSISERG